MAPRKRKLSKIAKAAAGFEETLHRWNPQIEAEFGPYLLNDTIQMDITAIPCWDNLVDRFLGRDTALPDVQLSIERLESITDANISFFLLLMEFVSAELMNAALYAGFFPFAIGLEFSSEVCEQDCGVVAFELAGRSQEKTTEDMGGRIILHGLQQLIVGKRALKEISKAVKSDPSQAFTLEWSTSWSEISSSWETLIVQHGVNWMGFTRIRDCLRELYHSNNRCAQLIVFQINHSSSISSPSLEDSEAASRCISLEVGYIIGACYTCLSNWSDASCTSFARIGQVRSAAVPIFLHQLGIQLFDVGGKSLSVPFPSLCLTVSRSDSRILS
jgi:hypothetical protein